MLRNGSRVHSNSRLSHDLRSLIQWNGSIELSNSIDRVTHTDRVMQLQLATSTCSLNLRIRVAATVTSFHLPIGTVFLAYQKLIEYIQLRAYIAFGEARLFRTIVPTDAIDQVT